MLANDFYDQLASYSLTVVPLFVLMGQLAFNAGIARRLYDSAHRFLGHIPQDWRWRLLWGQQF